MKRHRCAWLPLLAAVLPAQARVDLVVPAAPVLQFGREFVLEVRRTAPAGSVFAPFAAERLAPLRVGAPVRRVVAAATPGEQCEVLAFPARGFLVGEVVLPPFEDAVQLADGRAMAVRCDGLTLQLTSGLPEPPGDVEWPHDGRELAVPVRSWWWWALGVGLVVAGLGFASRRASPRPTPRDEPARDPGHEAEAQLLALDIDGDDLGFHVGLAGIVRELLAAHCRRRIDHWTSEELCGRCPDASGDLRACLSACDLAKFARAVSDRQARLATLAAARRVVVAFAPTRAGGAASAGAAAR